MSIVNNKKKSKIEKKILKKKVNCKRTKCCVFDIVCYS